MPLEVQGPVLPFWNPPVNISLDLDCQGCSSSFSVKNTMLENAVLLNKSLLYRSVTNEHHSKLSVYVADPIVKALQ